MTGDLVDKLLIYQKYSRLLHKYYYCNLFCCLLYKCWCYQHFWFPLMFCTFLGRRLVEIERLILELRHGVVLVSYQLTSPYLSFQTKVCNSSNVYLQDQQVLLRKNMLFWSPSIFCTKTFVWIYSFIKWLRQRKDVLQKLIYII